MILHTGTFMHLFGRISRRYMKKKDSRNYFWHVFFTRICSTAGTIIIIIQKKRGSIWIKQRHYRYTPIGRCGSGAIAIWHFTVLLRSVLFMFAISLVTFWDLFLCSFRLRDLSIDVGTPKRREARKCGGIRI
ncbi:hypothetical protein J3E68DRAFT_32166 [Trichoderma sp. SZMC 28012]